MTSVAPPRRGLIVAIDGPAGSGKSTVARGVAQKLGYALINTGALYRGVALAACEAGTDWEDGAALRALIEACTLDLVPAGDDCRLVLDGVDRTRDIYRPEISLAASAISRVPEVREALLGLQRRLGDRGGVVMEGRDIGTVIFPNAEIKVFLTANPLERARRRHSELSRSGIHTDLDKTYQEIVQRDQNDSMRPIAPLKAAPDAISLDSTDLSAEQIVDRIVELVRSHPASAGR